MKRVREFRTAGDFFYCEVTFLPEADLSHDQFEEILDVPTFQNGVHLRMSFLLRYPRKPVKVPSFRFYAQAHPNLSPVLVAEESSYFLSLIKQMIQL